MKGWCEFDILVDTLVLINQNATERRGRRAHAQSSSLTDHQIIQWTLGNFLIIFEPQNSVTHQNNNIFILMKDLF